MRWLLCWSLCLAALCRAAAAGELKEVWTVETGLKMPESAWYDPVRKIVYVSNIGTAPDKKDGTGFLSRYDSSGKLLQEKWITGLNAPKGIRGFGKRLVVSGVDAIVVMDAEAGKVERTIPVEGAKFLNDVAVDAAGNFYISDTGAGNIHRLDPQGTLTVFARSPVTQSPNGLIVDGDRLVVGGWAKEQGADGSTKIAGHLFTLDLKTGTQTFVTPEPLGNLDGLELDGQGGYFVSDWMNGKVFHVTADGKPKTLLSMKQGTADFAYLPEKRLLILPRMMEDKLTAYEWIE